MRSIYFLFFFLIGTVSAQTQATNGLVEKQRFRLQSISSEDSPQIDGQLDEAVWQSAQWAKDFVQYEPEENAAPSEASTFSMLTDGQFLYVAVMCYDQQIDQLTKRMSRRDGQDGDYVEIQFDSYHDLRSAFSFSLNSAGVKGDKMISLNGNAEDINWNPIWYGKTSVGEMAWMAEFKIPLSQLRFGNQGNQLWGLQVVRNLFRKNERSVWQRVPLDASGWVSEFGELEYLQALNPKRQLELQPFAVSSLRTFALESQNPFRDAYQKKLTLGMDGKVGITNDLTLDFTINPDFGQVEADPAAIALDGFQLFFNEQRPFFIENKNIFDYQFSNPSLGGSFSSDNLFYSRRIGRNPQGALPTVDNGFVNAPSQSTLLGAAKFSGKTKRGLSIGIMEAITANEYAEVQTMDGENTSVLIEPLSNYFVARVQQDLNQRSTFIGGILTSTRRDLVENINTLHRSASTAGLDVLHQWKNRSWFIGANLVASRVVGSKEAILATQRSIAHLFQREDASHVRVDPERTSLLGHGGDLRLGKSGQGNITFELGLTWRSPELELNDLGFMREADDIQNYLRITYRSLKPFGPFRQANFSYRHWLKWDFGGNLNYFDWDVVGSGQFNNNWGAYLGLYSQPHIYGKSLLQGGPRLFLPDQYGAWWGMNSDTRKQLYFRYSGWVKMGNSDSYFLFNSGLGLNYQPLDRLNFSMTPSFTIIRDQLQYNETIDYAGEPKYILARLDQNTLGLAFRFNYTINPNLSIQYYAEPYISTGVYQDFNYLVAPLAQSQAEQLAFFDPEQLQYEQTKTIYQVDENRDGQIDYQFRNPDFSFAQFRSNLVIRWEYQPGSELFLVWAQGITDFGLPGRELYDNFSRQIFNQIPENTFLLKGTYRFFR